MEIAVWGLAAAAFWPAGKPSEMRPRTQTTPRMVVACAAGLIAYLLLQSLPLPPALLESLSPRTADFHRHTVDVVAAATRPANELLPADWQALALHPVAARAEVLRFVAYLLVMLVASRLHRPRRFLAGTTALGIFVALFALVQAATWNGYLLWFFAPQETGPRPHLTRLTGPFVNPDHFALLLELILASTVPLLLDTARRIRRRRRTKRSVGDLALRAVLVTVGMAIVVGALLSTASRGGIVGGLLGLVVALTAWAFVTDPDPRGPGNKSDGGRWRFARTWAVRTLPFVVAPTVVIGGLL
ncbi:MAG: hypothetical protein ACREQJ_08150, partial [Candidatus Binatia bacterium]